MAKFYTNLSAGDTVTGIQNDGGQYGIGVSQDIDCGNVSAGIVTSTSFTSTAPEYLRVAHTDGSHNQDLPDNTTQIIQFDSVHANTKSGWTTGASNYYTIQETGYFLITTQAVLNSNTTSSLRDWALGVESSTDNGSNYVLMMNNGGRGGGNNNTDTDTITPSVTIVQYLSTGTRIRVRAYCNVDGGTWQVSNNLEGPLGGAYGGAGFDAEKGTQLMIMRLF